MHFFVPLVLLLISYTPSATSLPARGIVQRRGEYSVSPLPPNQVDKQEDADSVIIALGGLAGNLSLLRKVISSPS